MRLFVAFFFLAAFLCTALNASAQDSLQKLPSKYLQQVSSKAEQLEQKLDRKSEKALQDMQKLEGKIKKKLEKINPAKANELFDNTTQQYKKLEDKLASKASSLRQYVPSLDTLTTSLKFLDQNNQLLSTIKNGQEQLKNATDKVKGLEEEFQKAEQIKNFLKDRKQYLTEQLNQFGLVKELKQLNKQIYYYSEQLKEYKAMLKDHKKAEQKALELLSKTDLFQKFMRENSQLASLFRMPGNSADPTSQVSLAGLQTRAQVNNIIQQQIATGGPNAQAQFQQNLQDAQSQINQLKNKLNQLGNAGGSSDDIMPEGFQPNNQKTKSFLKRLEYGTNIQSQKPNGYFPVTSDIGLSLGYKLNDKSIIGIGASYKLGWGQSIRNISITSQGAGLRSFVDVKLKKSFWISGGYEMNYQSEFNRIQELQHLNAWQQSGLIGLSKVVSLKTKFFKKTKVQLLWDFLSYQQVPRTQPVLFRIGYNF